MKKLVISLIFLISLIFIISLSGCQDSTIVPTKPITTSSKEIETSIQSSEKVELPRQKSNIPTCGECQYLKNNLCEDYECCSDFGCDNSFDCINNSCIKEEKRWIGDGSNVVIEKVVTKGIEIFDPVFGYKIKFEKVEELHGKNSLFYSIYDSNNLKHKVIRDYSVREGSRFYPYYGIESDDLAGWGKNDGNNVNPGAFEIYVLRELPNNEYQVRVDFCPGISLVRAYGKKNILVLPIYFDDVSDELSKHDLRVGIYNDAFDEIKEYLKKKQIEFLGEEALQLDFTIASPVRADSSENYFNNYENIWSLVNIYDVNDFDIIAAIFYTSESCVNSHAAFHTTIQCRPPETVTKADFEIKGIAHAQRNFYTNVFLHEVLHEFGMTDGDGNQGKKICYVGDKYNGSQVLSDEICRDSALYEKEKGNIGSFQDLDHYVANQIGWSDKNDNRIIDSQEYCIQCYSGTEKYGFCE